MENTGPEVAEMEIVAFASLPACPELTRQLIQQISQHLNSKNWRHSFECITMIRAISKSYKQHICDMMNHFGNVLAELLKNGKPQVLKNLFELLKEVFSSGEAVENCVQMFLPLVIRKSSSAVGATKTLAQEVLTTISVSCGYPSTFNVAFELSCDKVPAVAEISIKFMVVILRQVGPNIVNLDSNTLTNLMKCLSIHIEGKKENMKIHALDICVFICQQIGGDRYLQLMNYALNQGEAQNMGQTMEKHRTQKVKPVPLATVLKNRKEEINHQQGLYQQEQCQALGNISNFNNY